MRNACHRMFTQRISGAPYMLPPLHRVQTPTQSAHSNPSDARTANQLDVDHPHCALRHGTPVATAPYGYQDPLVDGLQADPARFINSSVIEQLDRAVAPMLAAGCAIRRGVDQFGLFTVNQAAIEFPLGILGLVGKYGMQANLVRPRLPGADSNYLLQMFPLHDEFGFDYLKMFGVDSADLPLGCGGQIVRNHGIEIQLNSPDGDSQRRALERTHYYVEEFLVRPLEIDPRYRLDTVQGTLGSEFGCQLKWRLDNPNIKWALCSNIAANALGGSLGAWGAAAAGLPHLAISAAQGGAMVAALCTHYGQLRYPCLRPDVVLSWAGATYGPADVNHPFLGIGRGTFYPRIWWHAADGQFFPNQAQCAEALAMRRLDAEQTAQTDVRLQDARRSVSTMSAASAPPMALSQQDIDREFERDLAAIKRQVGPLRKRSVTWPPPDYDQLMGR